MTRARPYWLSLLLAALVFMAFAPALGAEWLAWDDDRNFLANEAWRGLSPTHLRWMATTFHMGPYQPLSWLSLGIDHALWDMNARGYHFTNLGLHALTAVALFALARKLFARFAGGPSLAVDLGATIAAAAFACHPLRVESVAWITERRDVLSGLFLVLFANAWLSWIERGSRGAYRIAVALFAASLASKGLGMTTPFVLVALDRFLFERDGRDVWFEKWPLFALAALAAVLAWHGQTALGPTMLGLAEHSAVSRLAVAAFGAVFYFRKQLAPFDLVPMESLNPPLDVTELRFVASAAAVLVATAFIVRFRRRAPGLAAAASAHALFLLPVIGLTQTGAQLVADRYSYLPSLGWMLLAGWIVVRLALRRPLAAGLVGVAFVVPLTVLTHAQTKVWHDTESLFRYALERRPGDLVATRNVAAKRLEVARAPGDVATRRAAFEEVVRLCDEAATHSKDPYFEFNAADAHRELIELDPEHRAKHFSAALERFDSVIARAEDAARNSGRTPADLPQMYATKGKCLMAHGDPAAAVAVFERLVGVDGGNAAAHFALANALLAADRANDALTIYERLAQDFPDVGRAWLGVGRARAALARNGVAREALERAITLLARDPSGARELAEARAALQDLR